MLEIAKLLHRATQLPAAEPILVRSKNQYVYDHQAINIKGDGKMGKQALDEYYYETGLDNRNKNYANRNEFDRYELTSTPAVEYNDKFLQARENDDQTDDKIDIDNDYECLAVKGKAFEIDCEDLTDEMAIEKKLNK